jgi:hypothetical protein
LRGYVCAYISVDVSSSLMITLLPLARDSLKVYCLILSPGCRGWIPVTLNPFQYCIWWMLCKIISYDVCDFGNYFRFAWVWGDPVIRSSIIWTKTVKSNSCNLYGNRRGNVIMTVSFSFAILMVGVVCETCLKSRELGLARLFTCDQML